MKGLSSLERTILECVGTKKKTYEQIQKESAISENVCFNLIQALIIRGLLQLEKDEYKISEKISPLLLEELNGQEAKKAESLEFIEAVLDLRQDRIFKFIKIAMDERDEKIFKAMLSNLESFLKDAHKKAESTTSIKDHKVVFWGMSEVQTLMKQIMVG